MMFVWSVKHLHDMELYYCLSNLETGLILNLLITELVLLDPSTLSVTSFEQFETYTRKLISVDGTDAARMYGEFLL